MSKRLGGITGCKYKTAYAAFTDCSPIVVTLGQQYNVGEKPTVMLYTTYINRHAGPFMTINDSIQYTINSVHFTIYSSPYSCMYRWYY